MDLNIKDENKKRIFNFGYQETLEKLPQVLFNLKNKNKKTRTIGTQTY